MWLNAASTFLKRRLARFAADDAAAVSVDFVVAIPILLAVLVFTSEYGRVLQMRSVLDNAVSDATRYLARAPRDPGDPNAFPPDIVSIAEQIIRQRVNVNHIAIAPPALSPANTGTSTPFDTVSMTVAIGVETPAISVIALIAYGESDPKLRAKDEQGNPYEIAYNQIEGFVLTSSDTARHFGQ